MLRQLISPAEQSQEELERLRKKAGLVAPITPSETAVSGGSPDQAKMSGTPAQTQAALTRGLAPQQTQAGADRYEQARTQATQQEEQAVQGAEQLSKLSGLSERVNILAQNQLKQAAQVEPVSSDPALQTAISALNDTDPNNDNQAIIDLANSYGITKPEQLNDLTAKIKSGMQPEQAIKESLSGTLTGQPVTVAQLDITQLGYNNASELAQELGLTEEELAGMTIDDLQTRIQEEQAREFSNTEQLLATLYDPTASPQERAEARKQLRDMGAVGVIAAESNVDELADAMVNADTVDFMGEQVDINELLSSEYVSGLAAKFYELGPDSEFGKLLKQDQPELAEFFTKYEQTLKDASAKLDTQLAQVSEINQKNLALAKPQGIPIEFSEEVMRKLIPNYGELSASSYVQPVALSMVNDTTLPKDTRRALAELLNSSPGVAEKLAKMSSDELRAYSLTNPNSDAYKRLMRTAQIEQILPTLNPNDPDSLSKLFGYAGTAGDGKDLNNMFKEVSEAARLGLIPNDSIRKFKAELGLSQGDNLSIANIYKAVQGKFKDGFPDIMSAMPDLVGTVDSLRSTINQANQDPVLSAAKSVLAKDGIITDDELIQLSDELTVQELDKLNNKFKNNMANAEKIKAVISDKLASEVPAFNAGFQDIIDKYSSPGEFMPGQAQGLAFALRTPEVKKELQDRIPEVESAVGDLENMLKQTKGGALRAVLNNKIKDLRSLLNSVKLDKPTRSFKLTTRPTTEPLEGIALPGQTII